MKMETYIKIKRASHRKSCPRKVSYETIESAKEARKTLKKHAEPIDIYLCYCCNKLHLGRRIQGITYFEDVTEI